MTRHPVSAAAAVLAATLSLTALTGCHNGSSSGDATDTATTSTPSTLSAPDCHTYERAGQRLGVTIPARFAVEEPPPGAAELARNDKVNLLLRARLYGDNGPLPSAELTIYSYGPEGNDDKAVLAKSFISAVQSAGGSVGTDLPTSATTVAGLPALTGMTSNTRALNFATPQPGASTVRYWHLHVGDAQYVVVLISRVSELDKQYSHQIVAGLHPGGCR